MSFSRGSSWPRQCGPITLSAPHGGCSSLFPSYLLCPSWCFRVPAAPPRLVTLSSCAVQASSSPWNPTPALHWRIMGKTRELKKKSISASLNMLKPLTVWITASCGKFYMQVKKQQLEQTWNNGLVQNWENSAVATGLEEISFHSNPKERQCQRMLKLLHNCSHLTC